MKISDRDTKLIVILLIAIVLVLPYLFIIRPTNDKIAGVDSEIATLQERLTYLQGLNAQRQFYIDETAKMNEERSEIILSYAPGVRQENTIMFLRETEMNIPVSMQTLSFNGYNTVPISEATVDEEGNPVEALKAVSTSTSVAYSCNYDSVKKLLEYIANYNERMVISAIDMAYNADTQVVSGLFVLNQYAIVGDGRELPPAEIPEMLHGNAGIFSTVAGEGAAVNVNANYGGDVYLALNPNGTEGGTKLMGISGNADAQIVNASNSKQSVTVKFMGENGNYSVSYAVGTTKYPTENYDDGAAITAVNDAIAFNIYSSSRAEGNDAVGANIKIINESDKDVVVSVSGDDAENPRVNIASTDGNVTVQ